MPDNMRPCFLPCTHLAHGRRHRDGLLLSRIGHHLRSGAQRRVLLSRSDRLVQSPGLGSPTHLAHPVVLLLKASHLVLFVNLRA